MAKNPNLRQKPPSIARQASYDCAPLQAGVEAVIRATGASVLYLPPYSPDLNPIEQVFSKLKALLRGAAAGTRDALWTTIGHLLDRFSPAECRNYLANSGYEFT